MFIKFRPKTLLFGILSLVLFYSCSTTQLAPEEEREEIETPVAQPKQQEGTALDIFMQNNTPVNNQEFRAAWVATVANINWPSKPRLSTTKQQQEALELLDYLQEHNFNAVIFQVRPATDALYKSNFEPWSYFLTGKQGQAPEPFYDPLNFWIEAAHDRGLELHVWLNPYRAHHTSGKEITEHSIIKTKPELVVELENGMWWMDPALKGTQDHSAAVVMDLVKRYDLDGVHFDDYFYPYDSYNNGKDFPDDKSWQAYKKAGGELSRGDWRRESVNTFIYRLYKEIKAEKPYVKFGLSPFGIWRPGYPESVTGYDQYDKLYADARLWLNEGWIDYFTPQLYWQINTYGQSFPELLGWWKSENYLNRHLWPGINVGLGGDEKNIDETINQIMITRGMVPQSKGTVHWSIGPLLEHEDLSEGILEGPYKNQALVPPSPWLDNILPLAPQVTIQPDEDKMFINWNHKDIHDVFRWVVYYKYENKPWEFKILTRKDHGFELDKTTGEDSKKSRLTKVGVTAVDRTGNESDFEELKIKL